jgi:hypothetical protein
MNNRRFLRGTVATLLIGAASISATHAYWWGPPAPAPAYPPFGYPPPPFWLPPPYGVSGAQSTPTKASKPSETLEAIDKSALLDEAKSAAMALGKALKSELQAALQARGPIGALDVCHVRAPELAKQVSAETDFTVRRVSLKNRNPSMGVPNEWQREVLESFEQRRDKGENPKAIAYADTVGKEFRFMKAIPTEAICLTCHGDDLQAELAAKLRDLYPDDKATGFNEGDLRGAFVVTKALVQ